MIQNNYKENFLNMIHERKCYVPGQFPFKENLLEYSFFHGKSAIHNLAKSEIQPYNDLEINNDLDRLFTNPKILNKRYRDRLKLYDVYLFECGELLKVEIKNNLLQLALENKVIYMQDLFCEFDNLTLELEEIQNNIKNSKKRLHSKVKTELNILSIQIIQLNEYLGYLAETYEAYLEPINVKSESLILKKYFAKFYALYHWILITTGKAKLFEKNEYDKYIKIQIVNYAKAAYPDISADSFYFSFIHLDITHKVAIAKNFGKGYKDKLIEISNNDATVIAMLKSFPN